MGYRSIERDDDLPYFPRQKRQISTTTHNAIEVIMNRNNNENKNV